MLFKCYPNIQTYTYTYISNNCCKQVRMNTVNGDTALFLILYRKQVVHLSQPVTP